MMTKTFLRNPLLFLNGDFMETIEMHEDYVIVNVNPELFSLDAVYLASFQMIEKAYVILDGDPDEMIQVKLIPKNKKDLKTVGWELSNQLLSSQVYDMMSRKSAKIKQDIIDKAMEVVDAKNEEE